MNRIVSTEVSANIYCQIYKYYNSYVITYLLLTSYKYYNVASQIRIKAIDYLEDVVGTTT